MRKYQPIWNKLKLKRVVSLAAPLESHVLIVSMVIKEKYNDIAWQLLTAEEGKKYKLRQVSEGSLLSLYLDDCTAISVDDL